MSDDWWQERQQNKRIQGLQEDLSYVSASLSQAQASQNRLKSELSKVRGSLEQRLDRLSAAFDAFVEISDLRVTLGLFDSHGRIRHQAKQLLSGAGLPEVADVDGYWLAPALVAMRPLADEVVDPEALALASARDPLRTGVFHVLATSVLGGRSTVPSLEAVLTPLPEQMPGWQRAVWLLAADGFFGVAGWELARRRCAEFVAGLPDGALSADLRAIAVPKAVVHIPKELDDGGDLATALQACEKLTVLRSWVTETLDAYTGEQAAAPDPSARTALTLLIDEGSAEELPLLARERELRAVIEGKSTPKATWDSPAGLTTELLREDVSAADHPGRRALAVHACAPVLLSVAEGFAKTARMAPPSSLSVRTRYGNVTITPTAPDATTLEKALVTAERVHKVESKRREAAYGAAAVGVLLVVLAVLAGWGWLFAAAAAFGIGAYQWIADSRERANAAREGAQAQETLRADAAKRVESFAKTRRELQDRQVTAEEDLKAIHAALGISRTDRAAEGTPR